MDINIEYKGQALKVSVPAGATVCDIKKQLQLIST